MKRGDAVQVIQRDAADGEREMAGGRFICKEVWSLSDPQISTLGHGGHHCGAYLMRERLLLSSVLI